VVAKELHGHHADHRSGHLEVEKVVSCACLQYVESSHVAEVQIEEAEVVGLDDAEVQADQE